VSTMAEQAKGQTDDITTETLEYTDKKPAEPDKDHDERVRAFLSTRSSVSLCTFDGSFVRRLNNSGQLPMC